ncbi:tRNA pseudouridine(38-40) synthase TruA [Sulfurimonas sp.]
MRVALRFSYNGTHFFGSQIQKETKNTVLGEIESVLEKLGMPQRVVASGRTDKGVHATGQVCHIDLPTFWSDLAKLKRTFNMMLPSSIYLRNIQSVHSDFHARYSAKRRVYRYIIKKGERDPFLADFVSFYETIDKENITKNIGLFVGEHDFKYFMKTGSDTKSTLREIYKAFTYEHKGYFILYFEANGFLRSQIRMMVGALLTLQREAIEKKLTISKNYKIKPAPANGLYLARIIY